MAQGIHDFQSKSYGAYLPSSPVGFDKAYGQDGSYIKNLGGANPELTNYYENQLLPYWQAVQSGEIQISQQDFAQLQQWMQYCQYELGLASSGWGNTGFGYDMEGMEGQGPVQNGTYTDAENEFTVDGSVATSDVWGNATLNVPPPCTATFETSTDNRFNPPETVVKAIITNPAMKGPDGGPAVSTVFIHDGGAITCNGSQKGDGTSRISDSTGTVTIGEYQAKAEDSKPESSFEGKAKDPSKPNELTYAPEYYGETIEFYPQEGEDQTHIVHANANISITSDSKATISYLTDGSICVKVTNGDGSVDTFLIQEGYNVNINGNPINITGDMETTGILERYAGRTSINGEKVGEAEGSTDASQVVDNLLEGTGNSEAVLLDVLDKAGYPYETRAELEEAITNGEFPGTPDEKLLRFLKALDTDLYDILSEEHAGMSNEDTKSMYEDASDRIKELLTILYPNSKVQGKVAGEGSSIWVSFSISGEEYFWNYGASVDDDFTVDQF